ncbi:MAG: hypothetical protein QOJ20_5801 [Mycobacterium sp.]|jgi:hypothetical protein|nr:hypothetical protein [Mycobacterium sp.]MDT5135637.1 hypothetical protein [Mycobacterium sp.]MDT5284606.1 hypothetical protein [Mycobacterium sp.]
MAGSGTAQIASARCGDKYPIVSGVQKRTRTGELDEIESGSRAGIAHQHAVITRLAGMLTLGDDWAQSSRR